MPGPLRGRALLLAASLLSVVTMSSGAIALADSAAPHQGPAAPRVAWGPCDPALLEPVPPEQRALYSCGTHAVPIDHANPSKGTVDLALMRRAAQDPAHRIGSLLLNPGGPGGAGYTLPVRAFGRFEQPVLDRFDLVGFDPRGVDRSTRLRCFASQEQADEVRGRMVPVPLGEEQVNGTMDAYRDQGGLCAAQAGELLAHMATGDVARDLDALRAAVGDRKLSYVGFSYGTLLGATYVNMFPERTRAIVLDGSVDPALRTSDGLAYDRQRAQGFEFALDAFLTRCAEVGDRCAFSSGDPRAKFDELREHLRAESITMPDGTVVDINLLTQGVGGRLYAASDFAKLAADLQAVYNELHPEQGQPVHSLAVLDEPVRSPRQDAAFQDGPYVDDAFFGVNCSDKPFPRDPGAVPGVAESWESESPTFGRLQAFGETASCSHWPEAGAARYSGPWEHRAQNPVLVIGNRYDPATQFEFARRMVRQLGNARLVDVDSFGHCILGGSACADRIAAEYLVDLEVPESGTVCQPDTQPFS